jgi:hypothetical protein
MDLFMVNKGSSLGYIIANEFSRIELTSIGVLASSMVYVKIGREIMESGVAKLYIRSILRRKLNTNPSSCYRRKMRKSSSSSGTWV